MENYFCIRLKELRIENKLTQKQLAKLISCSVYKIRKWEKCIAYPNILDAFALANCLNVDLDYLRGNSEIKEIKPFKDYNFYLEDNFGRIILE